MTSTQAVLDAQFKYFQIAGVAYKAEPGTLFVSLDKEGRLPKYLPSELSLLAEGILVFKNPTDNRQYAAKIYTLDDNKKLMVATDITKVSEDFRFMQWLGIASIFFVVLVVFASYLISVFVVKGTNRIANTVREIMETGDLSRRVKMGAYWDDLGNTAAVLNMLLDRIQQLMQGVRQVSDNIAHDLRTPLTRIRGQIEALEDSDSKSKLVDEVNRLLDTFNALLRISRIQSEKQRGHFTTVDLKGLVEDVIAFYEPLAEEKAIVVSSDLSEAHVHGDRDLLFQAYANILDNAVKFTPEQGKITVRLFKNYQKTYVEISNTGSGIAEDEKTKIFDRFYRAEQSRTTKGTGLGLSLVHAVIQLHNGDIRAENTTSGFQIITIL